MKLTVSNWRTDGNTCCAANLEACPMMLFDPRLCLLLADA